MTPEQQKRIEQIEQWQESRRGLVDSARKHADLDASHPEIRMHGYIDFLLSLVKSQEADAGSIDGELNDLRKEYELSGLGDRPHSISAAKLKRLIELENTEAASRENCPDCFGDAAVCVNVCGGASPIWPLARQIAGELDRQALLYASRDDRPLTDDELAPAIVVIVGVLSTEQSDAATSMRSACVEKLRAIQRKHEQTLPESEDYEYDQAAAFALCLAADQLESLSIEKPKE